MLTEMNVSLLESTGSGIHEAVWRSGFNDENVARLRVASFLSGDKT